MCVYLGVYVSCHLLQIVLQHLDHGLQFGHLPLQTHMTFAAGQYTHLLSVSPVTNINNPILLENTLMHLSMICIIVSVHECVCG